MTASDYVSEPAAASSKPNSSLPPPISREPISRFAGLSGTTNAAFALVTLAGDGCIAGDLGLSSCTQRRTTRGGMGSLSSSPEVGPLLPLECWICSIRTQIPPPDHELWRRTGGRKGLQEIRIHPHECGKQNICCLLHLLHHLQILHLNPARLLVQPQVLHPFLFLLGTQLRHLLVVLSLALHHHHHQ